MERAWSHVNPIIPRSWEKNLNLGWVILGFTMVYLIVWHNFLHQDEIVAVDDLVWICIGISSGKLPVDSIDIKSNLLSPQVYSKGHHHNNPSSIIHHPSSIIHHPHCHHQDHHQDHHHFPPRLSISLGFTPTIGIPTLFLGRHPQATEMALSLNMLGDLSHWYGKFQKNADADNDDCILWLPYI